MKGAVIEADTVILYTCAVCGYARKTFASRCAKCARWNTFHRGGSTAPPGRAVRLDKAGDPPPRVRTGIPALDNILGGGFVPGSSVLLYGGKGSGKSTLAAQAAFWSAVREKRPSLYCSGEEPWWQISERLERLELHPGYLYFSPELEVGRVLAECKRIKPALLVIDSAQKLDLPGRRGSDYERRVCALLDLLKGLRETRTAALLISQVNGQGKPKGGSAYEHEPDVVLKLAIAGEPRRQLEAEKNRYGSIRGDFLKMTAKGLV